MALLLLNCGIYYAKWNVNIVWSRKSCTFNYFKIKQINGDFHVIVSYGVLQKDWWCIETLKIIKQLKQIKYLDVFSCRFAIISPDIFHPQVANYFLNWVLKWVRRCEIVVFWSSIIELIINFFHSFESCGLWNICKSHYASGVNSTGNGREWVVKSAASEIACA